MKKNSLSTLLVIGIIAFAFGAYYWERNNFSLDGIQSSENNFKQSIRTSKKPGATGAVQAHEWRSLAWRDENGQIPRNAFVEAIRQRDEYLQQQLRPGGFSGDGVANLSWVSRGPQNVGGRTRSVIVHPTNPNTIWAGSVSGGVWKSVNGGASWTATNGNLQNLAVSSMAIDPNNPNVLYAGTGEGFFGANDALRGGGIYRTTDGGMTWNPLPLTVPNPNLDDWSSVDRISVAPGNSNLILAGTTGGIKRSVDGGQNWTNVRVARRALYLAFNPTNSSEAVAEVMELGNNPSHRVLYSIDSGESWNNAKRDGNDYVLYGTYERIELAYSRSNTNIVYSLDTNQGGRNVSRSTDGGKNYTSRDTVSNYPIDATSYHDTLWVSPTDPNFIVAGGQKHYKSTDGGNTFTRISAGYIQTIQPHVDQHCIVSDPSYNGTTNKRVYVCTDGGVYRTDDITTASDVGDGGWQRLDLTYQTAQYYGAAGHGPSGLIYGGTQDNATLRSPSDSLDATWTYGGDGGFAAIDPTDPNYCYGSHTNLKLHRSTDGGLTAHDIAMNLPDTQTGAANFVAPFILDPNDPTGNRMLAGGARLWRTNNVKAANPNSITWQEIYSGGAYVISAIAVAPADPDIIWIAQNDGKIYKTSNGTATTPAWTAIDNNTPTLNPLPNRFPTRILIDRINSNVVYIAFGGFSIDNLYRTTSGGTAAGAWQDITGAGLPNVPIRGIARHPTFNKLYVGTEIGVYVSEDNAVTWLAALDGPSNVSVDEVVFMSNSTTLIAATHGRGIWTSDENGTVVLPQRTVVSDFDGDGRSDESVYRPSNATWYINRSTFGFQAVAWGFSTDKLVAADYDGDKKTDIAVFRPSTGAWYRINSTGGAFMTVPFGQTGDFPVPADYDGDGKADEAIFRPSIGTWYINRSTLGVTGIQFGQSGDIPVPADYDGDNKADVALFRPSNGAWYIDRSNLGYTSISYGQSGDIPVSADYDGDGKADVAVFRPSNSTWYLNRSNLGSLAVPWGQSSDVPIPGGDYDGDGRADIAVFRPSDGRWYIRQSANGFLAVQFGASDDAPFPALH